MPKKHEWYDVDDMPLSEAVDKMNDDWIAGGNYSEYTVQRLRDGYKAVEYSVHLTAVRVGFVSFLAGSFLGWLVAYTQIGGR